MNYDLAVMAIRGAALMVPGLVLVCLWALREPDQRRGAAALLAGLWCLPSFMAIHLAALHFGWWHYRTHGGELLDNPVDLWFGWAILWGPIPVLMMSRVNLSIAVLALLGLDLLLMPLGAPVITLGPSWLLGEAAAFALCFVPAQLLARWTIDQEHLAARTTLQAFCFAGLFLFLLPATQGPWQPAAWMLLPAFIGVSATQEFAQRGHGTPFPFDPPRQLVTSGLYAYLANPMQLSAAILLPAIFFNYGVWPALAALTLVLAYCFGLAGMDEDQDQHDRFGEPWIRYRQAVRRWVPRWRPWVVAPALLYVSETCRLCRPFGQFVQRRDPVGLNVIPAERHPSRDLDRITYQVIGYETTGVEAFARALEHLNFGWAILGFALRLPLILPLAQLVVDTSGGGPRRIPRS